MTTSDVTSRLVRAKHLARRLMDRVAEPYVTDSVRRVVETLAADQPQPSAAMPPVVLHAALHEARSIALADMPPGADVVLSAGANGLWYFEWFDQEYGPVKHHIGVEAYMPRPDGLPDNVEWVEADLAAPEGVAAVGTGSVDLVFSGQNLEHLWPDQTVAFLVESNRVLHDDGLLVVDSPNRALTEAYQWSMAEHTVELEPSEAVSVLGLAGFAVDRMKGLWLCREAGRLLPLDPTSAMFGPGGYARRVAMATARPEDSFIWWAEARKVGRPDPVALRRAVTGIFESAWAERVARVRPAGGTEILLGDGSPGVVMPRGTEGYALAGPFMALSPGTYDFALPVEWSGDTGSHASVCRLELVADNEIVGSSEPAAAAAREGRTTLSCTVTLETLRFAVHARLWCSGTAEVRAPLTLTMSPEPWLNRVEPD